MRITPECIKGIGEFFSKAPSRVRCTMPKIPKLTTNKMKYIPEFSREVSKKALNKTEVLTRYSQKESLVQEEVAKHFSEIEQHLDEVSVNRLLKLTNEGKIKLYTKSEKSRRFLMTKGANTSHTRTDNEGVLNYIIKSNDTIRTSNLLKRLLAIQEEGLITPERLQQILKLESNGLSKECDEFIKLIQKGSIKNEQLDTAMIMLYNEIPLKALNPKNFSEFSKQELREISNVLRTGNDENSQNLLMKISAYLSKSTPVNKVSNEVSTKFINNFDKIAEDLAKSGKTMDELVSAGGIRLSYPRQLFKENILKQIKHLNESEQAKLLNKFGLEKDTGGRLNGLPVFHSDNTGFSEVEKLLNNEIGKFLNENKIVLPKGFEEYRKPLEEICNVFPEFKYVIGVQTNPAHNKPIAEHILMAFQENMKNPLYKTLNASDRRVIGISTLLHDINKIEKVKLDTAHPIISSQTAQAITERMQGLSVAEKDRIIDLVKNHHWLEGIKNGTEFSEKEIQDLAVKFRCGNDITLAKIFAESDLKAVNEKFFRDYGGKLDSTMVKALEDQVFKIQAQKGRLIYNADLTIEKGIAKGAIEKTVGEGANTVTNRVIKAKDLGMDNEMILAHQLKDGISNLIRAKQGCIHGGEGIFSTVTTEFGNLKLYYNNDNAYFLGFREINQGNILFAKQGKSGWERGYDYLYKQLNSNGSSELVKKLKETFNSLAKSNITDEQYVKAYRAIQGVNINEIHLNENIQKIFGENAKYFEQAVKDTNRGLIQKNTQVVIADPEIGFLGTTVPYEQMDNRIRQFCQKNNLLIVEF